jgi:peptide/nickel transport system substrate-binding protein
MRATRVHLKSLIAVGALLTVLSVAGSSANGAPEKPRLGGVYIKNNIYSDPVSMDPLFALGADTIMVQMNIFDGLVQLSPDSGAVAPDLAVRWTHTPDAKTFTFYLRKGALYHDGTEVTAADFKYQFERVANPANLSPHMARLSGVVGYKAYQEKRTPGISGITVVDKHTLRITMEQPNILLPHVLTGTWAAAVPRPVVERLGKEFGTRPVGSGPFIFGSWARGREIVLLKFPKYWRTDQWGNRLPYVDKVVFRKIREMPAVEAEIEAGRIDSAYIRFTAYPKYKRHPIYKDNLIEGVEYYTVHVGFNLDIPGAPWKDKRVRQAVAHAVDGKAIVDAVLHGMGYPARGLLPMMLRESQVAGYEYNPEKARQLLAEAGYRGGFTAKLTVRDSPQHAAAAETVAGFLSEVGVRIQVEILDSTTGRVRIQDGKMEMYLSSLGGEGHPLVYLLRGFHSRYIGPGGNWTRYRNPTVDQLLDRAAAARDMNTMLRLVQEAERIIAGDVPWAPLYYLKGVVVKQPYVRGLRPVSTDMDWQPLDEVWLTETPKGR